MEIQLTKSEGRIGKAIKTLYFYFCLFSTFPLHGDFYEGISMFSGVNAIEFSLLQQFLPYNPLIIEAGAFRGDGIVKAARIWPQGRIIAFEPDPNAYEELEKNIRSLSNVELHPLALNSYNGSALFNICLGPNNNEPAYGYASSLLPLKKGMEVFCRGPQIEVPCMTLDSWCEANAIDAVDLLHLEVEGAEYSVLKNSPKILKTVKVLFLKTFIHPHRLGMTDYSALKEFLERSNFVLLSHRFQPGVIGHAIFLSRELFDAYFKLSLGIYLEV